MKPVPLILLLVLLCSCSTARLAVPVSPTDRPQPAVETLSLARAAEDLSVGEVQVLLGQLGLHQKRFDYEVDFDHCLDFSAQVPAEDGSLVAEPANHLCQRAGAYRLMLISRREGERVLYSAYASPQDRGSYGWVLLGTYEPHHRPGVTHGSKAADPLQLTLDQTVPIWSSRSGVLLEVTLRPPHSNGRSGFIGAPYSLVEGLGKPGESVGDCP